MRLPALEFMRRFLLHVWPPGFVRIRYFGLWSNRDRTATLRRCRALLAGGAPPPSAAPETAAALLKRLTGVDVDVCPVCGVGRMRRISELDPAAAFFGSAVVRSPTPLPVTSVA